MLSLSLDSRRRRIDGIEIESEWSESEEDSGSESLRSSADGIEISEDGDADSESDINKVLCCEFFDIFEAGDYTVKEVVIQGKSVVQEKAIGLRFNAGKEDVVVY